jgi:anti-sigma-K factor RskA
MADEHTDSIKNLFQALRDMADSVRQLEMRTRVLEEKRYQTEGELAQLVTSTKLQLERLVSDAESEKGTRGRSEARTEKRLLDRGTADDLRFVNLEKGQLKIQLWIASATAIILFAVFLINLYFSAKGHG